MKILWFTWKDRSHPLAGGAEVVNEELAKRLAKDGHEVLFIVGGYEGGKKEDAKDGFRIIRLGNRYTVYWCAFRYYRKHLRGWADLVIDEVNTIPFMAKFYTEVRKSKVLSPKSGFQLSHSPKVVLFVHQLCREIWFHQMIFPLSVIGYILEPLYLRMLASRFRLSTLWTLKTFDSPQVITVSESTKKDLMRYGFKEKNIYIISEGIEIQPVERLEAIGINKFIEPEVENLDTNYTIESSGKYGVPTMLSFGALRSMKRTDQIVKAFELIKSGKVQPPSLPLSDFQLSTFNFKNLQLIIAGCTEDRYSDKIRKMVENSPYKDSIKILGKVSKEKKIELMQRSHVLCVTSVKEGWGLVVTEAASQGTPSVVYNVDGLRDSVRHNETGLVCEGNTPESLAENVMKLLLTSKSDMKLSTFYLELRENAWEWSKEINFERSYEDFKKIIRELSTS